MQPAPPGDCLNSCLKSGTGSWCWRKKLKEEITGKLRTSLTLEATGECWQGELGTICELSFKCWVFIVSIGLRLYCAPFGPFGHSFNLVTCDSNLVEKRDNEAEILGVGPQVPCPVTCPQAPQGFSTWHVWFCICKRR